MCVLYQHLGRDTATTHTGHSDEYCTVTVLYMEKKVGHRSHAYSTVQSCISRAMVNLAATIPFSPLPTMNKLARAQDSLCT